VTSSPLLLDILARRRIYMLPYDKVTLKIDVDDNYDSTLYANWGYDLDEHFGKRH
jgi:hypothetical protein